LEEILGKSIKVIDRSALILDIFSQHARTREGMQQVELAQLEYRLPRLTRAWTHLRARLAAGRTNWQRWRRRFARPGRKTIGS
jgi:GTP-binding protein HflX